MTEARRVRIKRTDSVYPNALANVVKVDQREGRPYLGLEITEDPETMAEVGHTVWRFEDQVEG